MLMSFTLFKILNEHVFDFDDYNNDSSDQSWGLELEIASFKCAAPQSSGHASSFWYYVL